MSVLFNRDSRHPVGQGGPAAGMADGDRPEPGASGGLDRELALEQVVAQGLVRAEFQPIVWLDHSGAVAFEAFARGPADSRYSSPRVMFEEAARAGLTRQLDQAAHAAAYRAALKAKLHPSLSLFVNADPATIGQQMSPELTGLVAVALSKLRVLIEISEHHLADNPSAALAGIARARACGWGISWDHLGATPDSVALMPFVQPDVVKLDVGLAHQGLGPSTARVISAVSAYAERSGASVMATGIETREHLQTALGMGAVLGQGFYFGRPAALPTDGRPPLRALPLIADYEPPDSVATPFELLAQRRPPSVASLSMVQAMAHHLEQRCSIDPEPAVVVASLPHDQLMSGDALAKLQITARNTAFVAALLRDRVPYPVPGVRTAVIGGNDNLRQESTLAVVGPHFSALLTSRANPHATGPTDAQLVGISHHRDTVLHAARTLLHRFTNAETG